MPRNNTLNKYTKLYKQKYNLIAGLDEVGRGPLIGSVVAGAVILPAKYKIKFLTDSKKLSEKQREIAFYEITQQAVAYATGSADHLEIDQINILQASLKAMKRALANLSMAPEIALVDGNRIPPEMNVPAHAIIGGDLSEHVISAASIIAKVNRDREMLALHDLYPQYGFADHKGYATKKHLAALKKYGALPQHRVSFAPVKLNLENSEVFKQPVFEEV